MNRRWMRALVLASTFAMLVGAFLAVARPWYLQWGASDVDAREVLPGDGIVPGAAGQETRGITIDAGAEWVWPWVAQIGQDRGGFYSFDLLENLVGCRMPTADHPRPDLQRWRVGDKLWMYPPQGAGGVGFATLRTYIPERALAFGTRAVGTSVMEPENGSWALVVQPLDRYTTRLLFRGRGAPRSWAAAAFDRTVFEPMHFVMERRMLIGIKQLAEGDERHRWLNHLQVGLWTATFALFFVSAVQVVRSREWRRPLATFVASAVAFQVLTFVQPHVAVGLTLVAALVSFHYWPHGSAVQPIGERAIMPA